MWKSVTYNLYMNVEDILNLGTEELQIIELKRIKDIKHLFINNEEYLIRLVSCFKKEKGVVSFPKKKNPEDYIKKEAEICLNYITSAIHKAKNAEGLGRINVQNYNVFSIINKCVEGIEINEQRNLSEIVDGMKAKQNIAFSMENNNTGNAIIRYEEDGMSVFNKDEIDGYTIEDQMEKIEA
ncbi:MAG TPA: hypothetical protein DCP90_07600 [Clostridiales bacterium]|nr:MAG: hypothetical protein A2Y22_04170 [Clostridiales bacterium GWD2_32_59]HAN10462.1 hypothetical protein [Clostridiales bacterium]